MADWWKAIVSLLVPGASITDYAICCFTNHGPDWDGDITAPGKTVILMWNGEYDHYEAVFPGKAPPAPVAAAQRVVVPTAPPVRGPA
eukprot:gene45268-1546_t